MEDEEALAILLECSDRILKVFVVSDSKRHLLLNHDFFLFVTAVLTLQRFD